MAWLRLYNGYSKKVNQIVRYRKLRKLKKEYNQTISNRRVQWHNLTDLTFRYGITIDTTTPTFACMDDIESTQYTHQVRKVIDEFIQQETKNLLQLWTIIAIIFAGAVGAVATVVAWYLSQMSG